MRLTLYTDYTLRVLMYLSVKPRDAGVATIDEIAQAYRISRHHLTKIVSELTRHGMIETVRGRTGGARLAKDPSRISIGQIVRIAEKDLAVVDCHDEAHAPDCAIAQACHLTRIFRRATDAFLRELDEVTLADAVTNPEAAAPLLGIASGATRIIPIASGATPAPTRPSGPRARASTRPASAPRRRPSGR